MINRKGTGPIQKNTIYPLGDFMGRVGMGEFAIRNARRAGLKVVRIGKKVFIRGEDFISFLDAQAEAVTASAK